ncbi:MAG: hypothetical protein KJZ85_08860 [Rhodobacteraceae bacterium]|jgi:hypothetical protein|nr:hypothetical protein [Paracoccaceae bacterium]
MRIAQPEGARGSLKWIQRCIAARPDLLQPAALAPITWLSPLAEDDFAEYRDGAFLDRLGLDALKPGLARFWPARGPQWDALGRAGSACILLEAKAHVREFLSPPTAARGTSRSTIESALRQVRDHLGVSAATDWSETFFQVTNRLAHLWWLQTQGVEAHLVFASFLGDAEMGGPDHPETWQAAFRAAEYALGLKARHALAPFVHHVWPDVRLLS